MSGATFFDDKEAGDAFSSIDPIWLVDYQTDSELLAWDKRTKEILYEKNRSRNERTKANISVYRGVYSSHEPVVGGARILGRQNRQKYSKVVVAHSQDLVEQKVATQLKYKPNFELSPDSQELSDKQHSIAAKRLLDSNDYWTGAPKDYHRAIRHAILAGQGWLMPYWSPYVGQQIGKQTEELSIRLKNGSSRELSLPVRAGDVMAEYVPDWEIFLFPAESLYKVSGFMREYVVHTDELRAQYPDVAEDILPSRGAISWNWNNLEDMPRDNHTICRAYYFKSDRFLPEGLQFLVTDTCVLVEPKSLDIPPDCLEQEPLGNLPISRLTDIDIEGEIDGYPSFSFIAPLQNVFDMWFSLCLKNHFLFCHPKWAYQQNSVDIANFSNGSLLLPHRSNVPPQLQIYQALTQDQLKFGEIIMTSMEKVIRISGVSRGAPPPGTRAAASLYFYDEQEQTANSIFRRKFEDFVVRFQTLKLALMSKFYDKPKKRLVWVLGRNDEWLADSIDVSSLQKKYTIRVRSASNLPDSKFARIQALLDVSDRYPNVVTEDHILEMMDFGQQEKFIDYGRVSVMAAEAENEALMTGEEVPSPEPYEMQEAHWKTHVKLAQDPNFKKQPKKIQEEVEAHIGGHEIIMLVLGEKNPAYKQKLLTLDQFPLFALLPPPMPLPPGAPPKLPGPGPTGGPSPKNLSAALTGGESPSQPQSPPSMEDLAGRLKARGAPSQNNPVATQGPVGDMADKRMLGR